MTLSFKTGLSILSSRDSLAGFSFESSLCLNERTLVRRRRLRWENTERGFRRHPGINGAVTQRAEGQRSRVRYHV